MSTKREAIEKPITPAEESAACGIGFIATTSGTPSHEILRKGIEVLTKMEHRGGVAPITDWERVKAQYEERKAWASEAEKQEIDFQISKIDDKLGALEFLEKHSEHYKDNYTTDGRGLMVEVDQEFFKTTYLHHGRDVTAVMGDRDMAVGVFYLPKDNRTHQDACRKIIDDVMKEEGYYEDARWRLKDHNEFVLGEAARKTYPSARQIMIPQKKMPKNVTAEEKAQAKAQFDRDLFFMRKKIEDRTKAYFEQVKQTDPDFKPEGSEDFYCPSMSRKVVVYKGLSVAEDIDALYDDLKNPDYKTRFVIPHSRYSTNTAPAWRRAHPYRHIAHNGEINSLKTNINMIGRIERVFTELFPEDKAKVEELFPIIQDGGTDSAMLDNAVEFLLHAGLSPAAVKMVLVPEAFEQNTDLSDDVRAAYQFIDTLTQPWDGPNTMVIAGNDEIVIGGDRSGLRPNRAKRTRLESGEELISVLSEDMDLGGEDLEKWNQEPGEMVGVDLNTGTVYRSDELKARVAKELEEKFGIKNFLQRIVAMPPAAVNETQYKFAAADQERALKLELAQGNLTQEHVDFILGMAKNGKEGLGSMGDDAALTMTSGTYRTVNNFFQQSFAQVTNPPLDTIREKEVLSLKTKIGSPVDMYGNWTDKPIIELESPILSNTTFKALREKIGEANVVEIPCVFDIRGDEKQMQFALERIKAAAKAAAEAGKQIVLTDEQTNESQAAVPMLLAAGAVNSHLLELKLRDQTSINVTTRQASYSHDFATLIGLGGADTVNARAAEEMIAHEHQFETHRFKESDALYGPQTPLSEFVILYRAEELSKAAALLKLRKSSAKYEDFFKRHADQTLEQLAAHPNIAVKKQFTAIMGELGVEIDDLFASQSVEQSIQNYIKAGEISLLKTMGKMGIAHVSSYRGGRLFEALGVGQDVIDECFPGVKTKVKGLSLSMIQQREIEQHKKVYAQHKNAPDAPIKHVGRYKVREDSEAEPHLYTSEAISVLQDAVKKEDFEEGYARYKEFRDIIMKRSQEHRFAIRDWMDFKSDRDPVDVNEVEPYQEIVKRFFTGAMSFGSISEPAHETLAQAMNALGGKSNSGEGGENPLRYGTDKSSKIKQVASGRFGVSLDYLMDAEAIQIKVAQGAKPGEGGELPGHKVKGLVAEIRGVNPGTGLISPPPHHDIYSIEDLEQLIYDLKQVNPHAKIDVKLVSASGVDVVANGVAKAYADRVNVSGSNGGTGASPQTSIVHAGMPWETSINPVHRSLVQEHLRERLKFTTDGGMHIGRDLVIAAMMGAEEYGFGLQALMAEGCQLLRICQTGKCAPGVATNDPELVKHFEGTPEMVQNMMLFIARDMQETIAGLGFKSVDEILGRTDLLEQVWGDHLGLDLDEILGKNAPPLPQQKCELNGSRNERPDPQRPNYVSLDDDLWAREGKAIMRAVKIGSKFVWDVPINNEDRTFGARTSYNIRNAVINDAGLGRYYKLKEDTITLNTKGIAGQSFGAFGLEGITMRTNGANDGAGKSLSGAKLVFTPKQSDTQISLHPEFNTIVGNAALYGATKGQFYAAGRAGNRFAVRMSGGEAVIDGAGSHACNYMTGGNVAILGKVGKNFGSGMSGGRAFVFDENNMLARNTYEGTRGKISLLSSSEDKQKLHSMITKHFNETGDQHAKRLLEDWDNVVHKFKVVKGAAPAVASVPEAKVA